jgi:hypothetical protein
MNTTTQPSMATYPIVTEVISALVAEEMTGGLSAQAVSRIRDERMRLQTAVQSSDARAIAHHAIEAVSVAISWGADLPQAIIDRTAAVLRADRAAAANAANAAARGDDQAAYDAADAYLRTATARYDAFVADSGRTA